MYHWLQLFSEEMKETSLMQWLAVILGVAEVLFAFYDNIWLYPPVLQAPSLQYTCC
jgi:nicotinamide mononucleotide transporter